MASYNSKESGQIAEQQACDFLQSQGLHLLEQNYRCYCGEIDLIMQEQKSIVFVEVRSRRRTDYGNAFESVNWSKRKKLIRTATYFLQMKKWLYKVDSRFDIVAIHPVAGKMKLEWIRNAFTVDD
jgi:putative endonuclease